MSDTRNNTTRQPLKKVTANREDALNHVRAVEASKGVKISSPVAYFKEKIAEISARLNRSMRLDVNSEEMRAELQWMSPTEYFRWLRGVLEYQKAYLKALQS